MSRHPGLGFVGGDDWEINATLFDDNGDPYNLTAAQILWTLYNSIGNRVLDSGDYSVVVTDAAAGKCTVKVVGTKTTTIPSGQYMDAMRVVIGGVTSTPRMGLVYVTGDPWAVAA